MSKIILCVIILYLVGFPFIFNMHSFEEFRHVVDHVLNDIVHHVLTLGPFFIRLVSASLNLMIQIHALFL